MKKCKDCVNFVHNPPIFETQNGRCEITKQEYSEEQDCCSDFKERIIAGEKTDGISRSY